MDLWEAVALLGAGVVAGAINAVVGSGTLDHLPDAARVRLLAGARQRHQQHRPRARLGVGRVGLPARAGGAAVARDAAGRRVGHRRLIGAIALLELPASAFDAIVPVLILLACALVILQPWLSRWSPSARARPRTAASRRSSPSGSPAIYGGYFGAAQGVLLMAFLGILDRRAPAAAQRGQERARGAREPRRGDRLRARERRRLGRRGDASRSARPLGGHFGGTYGRRLPPVGCAGSSWSWARWPRCGCCSPEGQARRQERVRRRLAAPSGAARARRARPRRAARAAAAAARPRSPRAAPRRSPPSTSASRSAAVREQHPHRGVGRLLERDPRLLLAPALEPPLARAALLVAPVHEPVVDLRVHQPPPREHPGRVPAEPHQQHADDALARGRAPAAPPPPAPQRRERRIALEHRAVGRGQRHPLRRRVRTSATLAVLLDPALEPALEPLRRDLVALELGHDRDATRSVVVVFFELALEHLARGVARELVEELDLARDLVAGEVLLDVLLERLLGRRSPS